MNAPLARRHLQARSDDRSLREFQLGLNAAVVAWDDDADAPRLGAGYWAMRRRAPTPADMAVLGKTLDWLMALPKQVRPDATVDRFPRVVNQLAEAWRDQGAIKACFDNLLHDKRSGRKGFPAEIKRELKILRFHCVATQSA